MVKIRQVYKERYQRTIKLDSKNLDKTINLVSYCNGCYSYKDINFYDISDGSCWNNCYEPISFFNIDYDPEGFEDRVKAVYIDNETVLVDIIRYYFEYVDYVDY